MDTEIDGEFFGEFAGPLAGDRSMTDYQITDDILLYVEEQLDPALAEHNESRPDGRTTWSVTPGESAVQHSGHALDVQQCSSAGTTSPFDFYQHSWGSVPPSLVDSTGSSLMQDHCTATESPYFMNWSHPLQRLDSSAGLRTTSSSGSLSPKAVNSQQSGNQSQERQTASNTGTSVGDENGPSSLCACFSSIVGRLVGFQKEKAAFSPAKFDHIFHLLNSTTSEIRKVTKCKACEAERARLMLLVGIVLDILVDFLESIAGLGGVPTNAETTRGDMPLGEPTSLSHLIGDEGASLQLGQYEIRGEEKLGIVRLLTRARMSDIHHLARELQDHMEQFRASKRGFRFAANVIAEIGQRVHVLMQDVDRTSYSLGR
jgi:hypothetical protein